LLPAGVLSASLCKPLSVLSFLCHCRVGCVLRFLIFFEGSGIFLKQFCLESALQALCQSFGLSVGLCGFGNVLAIDGF